MESEFAWKLVDYKKHDVEPPERIIENPELTEGDMMTEDEIEEYFKDSLAVMAVMRDSNAARANQVRGMFLTDLAYLRKINRIEDSLYDELMAELGEEK